MFKYTRMVQTSEVGVNHHIRPFDLINMIQDLEGLHLDGLISENNKGEEPFYIVLNFRYVHVISWPKFKDMLKLRTHTFNTTPFYGYRNTIIYNEKEEPVVLTYSVGSFIKPDTLTPHRMSKKALALLVDETPFPMNYQGRKINTEGFKDTNISETLYVRPSFIDYNQHLNNAYYVDFAANLLSNDVSFNTIVCEYRYPYMLGDKIVLSLMRKEDDYLVVFLGENDKIYALIEFKNES
ncbi:MAG TPA: acyl-ACP thioesterase domain-containing protein [Acholeplasma sp.]|jgi:medium-chain acyl-[acyl-carrier-protein] hydrolase